jgi:hypothetical protein
VSFSTVLTLFALGAAAVALWVEVRYPQLSPTTMRLALIHVVAAMAVGQLIVPFGLHVLVGLGSPVSTLAALFLVGFPALVYSFLAALWVIKIVVAVARRAT